MTSYPSTPLNVQWDHISDPAKYETLVACLLCNLHPTSIHIDGAGGDGGKDIHFPGPEGLEIFEMKSFTKRMTNSRRAQVKRSYLKAMQHQPRRWFLVVPINPTPGELQWFQDVLTKDSKAHCEWLGKTWLDLQMALFPQIPRYFLGDVRSEVDAMVKQFNVEQAALSKGVPDAIERMKGLMARCGELDPFYRIDISVDDGKIGARLIPRYPGAERERPIQLHAVIQFPSEDVANEMGSAMEEALVFGSDFELPPDCVKSVIVDAPAGLGGEFSGGLLKVGPTPIPDAPDFQLVFQIVDSAEGLITSLPITGKASTIGSAGAVVGFHDGTGTLVGELRLDNRDQTLQMKCHVETRACLPSALIPVARFLEAFDDPHQLIIYMDNGKPMGPPVKLPRADHPPSGGYIALVELIARVQAATGVFFDMPESLSQEEIDEFEFADDVLAGRLVEGTWSAWTLPIGGDNPLANLKELLATSGGARNPMSLELMRDVELSFRDKRIPLGQVTTKLDSARFTNADELEHLAEQDTHDGTIEVQLAPANSTVAYRWRGSPTDRPAPIAEQ